MSADRTDDLKPPPPPPPPIPADISSAFSTLSSVIGQTNVALRGASGFVSSSSDFLTATSSAYSQPGGTTLSASSAKLIADITYDRLTTAAAVGVGGAAEATAAAFTAGLTGAGLSSPSGPGAVVVGAATAVGTYAYLNSSTVREGVQSTISSAVSSVYSSYDGAMQRGVEAYREAERALYDYFQQPFGY